MPELANSVSRSIGAVFAEMAGRRGTLTRPRCGPPGFPWASVVNKSYSGNLIEIHLLVLLTFEGV